MAARSVREPFRERTPHHQPLPPENHARLSPGWRNMARISPRLPTVDTRFIVSRYFLGSLPQASGRKKQSVALARTVLQRRLASSTQAIAESIRRRLEKQEELLEELESLSPAQRAKRLAAIQGRISDGEQDEDDLDDSQRDLLTDEFTTAVELDQLRTEIAALRDLLAQARRVRDHANDSKLTALRECLAKAEFNELI